MKKFISYLLSIFTICNFNFYSMACNINGTNVIQNLDILEIEKQESLEIMLSDVIKKKENITYLKYNYEGDFKNNDYKYKTVRVETTYYDIGKNCDRVIAVAYMEFNFRYNEKLNESKCLSTAHGQMCNDNRYDLKVFTRTKNLSYEVGESFGSLEFTKKGMISKQLCGIGTIFCCDALGNIIHKIQQV